MKPEDFKYELNNKIVTKVYEEFEKGNININAMIEYASVNIKTNFKLYNDMECVSMIKPNSRHVNISNANAPTMIRFLNTYFKIYFF